MPVTAISTSENTGYPLGALGFNQGLPMEASTMITSSTTPTMLSREQHTAQHASPQIHQSYMSAGFTQALTNYLKDEIKAIDKFNSNELIKKTTVSWPLGKRRSARLSEGPIRLQEIDTVLYEVVGKLIKLWEELKLSANYRPIGWHKAPYGDQKTQGKVRHFWVSQSDPSDFRWLLTKASTEHNVEVLDALSDILSERLSLNTTLISDVLGFLETDNVSFQETILRAFQWTSIEEESEVARLAEALTTFFGSREETIREAAYFATRALPNTMATELLKEANAYELNTTLRDVISEELATYEQL